MSWEIRQGDALERLKEMPDESVQCCITSPPYWGLRDYGTAEWEGGAPDCDHDVRRWDGPKQTQGAMSGHAAKGDKLARSECACGARRMDSQLGLESTPDEYVSNLAAVFGEVRRVLRSDGTLWLNLGDSYAGYWGDKTAKREGRRSSADTNGWTNDFNMNARPDFHTAFDAAKIKPKDLVGIPWRVAFALQADGWWLRSDIVWAKPNPMPESVRDRPTRSHEYVFLLAKSERYFYDADAIREEHLTNGNVRDKRLEVWGGGAQLTPVGAGEREWNHAAGRNRRSVWTVTTKPYPEAHFATFPPDLVEPMVLAGSTEGDTILDPFAGAGTTGLVALRHGRSFIGIELNPDYCKLARHRLRDDQPLFNVPAEKEEDPLSTLSGFGCRRGG